MYHSFEKEQKEPSRAAAHPVSVQRKEIVEAAFSSNQPEAILQRKLQRKILNSHRVKKPSWVSGVQPVQKVGHNKDCGCDSCSGEKKALPVQRRVASTTTGIVIQRMCDHLHLHHPNGRCPDYEYGYQSGLPVGSKSSASGSHPPAPPAYSRTEELALSGMEAKKSLEKQAEYRSLAKHGETQSLLPMSDAYKQHKLGHLKEGVAATVAKKVGDKASEALTGHEASGLVEAGLTMIDAAKMGPSLPRPGYDRIPDHPLVEESYTLLPKIFSKNLVQQGGKAGGAAGGAALGTLVAPGLGTVVGGFLGGKIGGKATDTATGAGADLERARTLIIGLHSLAREGDSAAIGQLKNLGLNDELIKAHDGWKVALEKLPQ